MLDTNRAFLQACSARGTGWIIGARDLSHEDWGPYSNQETGAIPLVQESMTNTLWKGKECTPSTLASFSTEPEPTSVSRCMHTTTLILLTCVHSTQGHVDTVPSRQPRCIQKPRHGGSSSPQAPSHSLHSIPPSHHDFHTLMMNPPGRLGEVVAAGATAPARRRPVLMPP